MKNYSNLGGCYPPRPSASVDNILRDLHNSSLLRKPNSIIANYVVNLLLIKFISSSFDKRALVNTQESVSLFIILFFKLLFNFFVNFHSSARLNEYKILQKLLFVVVVVQLCLVLSRPDYQTTKSINS